MTSKTDFLGVYGNTGCHPPQSVPPGSGPGKDPLNVYHPRFFENCFLWHLSLQRHYIPKLFGASSPLVLKIIKKNSYMAISPHFFGGYAPKTSFVCKKANWGGTQFYCRIQQLPGILHLKSQMRVHCAWGSNNPKRSLLSALSNSGYFVGNPPQ